MQDHEVVARHKAARGSMRPEELLRFKSAVRSADPFVPAQRFADYSKSGERGPSLSNGSGAAELFGKDAVGYLSFIGLRADERMRVANMRRKMDERTGARNGIPDGELVETPLCDAGIASDDVTEFWRRRPNLDLKLPPEANLSNCAFCFMKGAAGIRRAASAAGTLDDSLPPRMRSRQGTPSDLQWWVRLEERYSRTYPSKVREGNATSGFFGVDASVSYAEIAKAKGDAEGLPIIQMLPCHCTD